ncbi:hypothetical protein AML11_22220 [Escherichia coli]|nr:hypothetical protein BXO92_23335 [Escherichia coli]KYR65788.1 hypothetical protein AML11_22220 [Escherichia coli]KYS09395.1 hypothetical protein AML18_06065 [Escherichia coli]KYS30494.1 hypothetical protein AML22_04450 [Escherichia coli]KYS56160.1 hypothetical protein AML27_13065 [Escherichia coli]
MISNKKPPQFFHPNGRFLTFKLMTTTLFIDHFARKLENLASSSILKEQGN